MGTWLPARLQEMDPEQAQQLLQAIEGTQELDNPLDSPMGAVLALIYALIALPLAMFMITSMATVFIKAGKPWWAAIIPVYNIVVFLEIIGKPLWWLIMFFVPFVSIVFGIMATHALSRAFGKDVGFTVGMLLLPALFGPMLAFGTSQYQGAPA